MLRRINDMPAGTIGFEAIGEVEDDDWEEAVEPLLRREIAAGREGPAAVPARARGARRRGRRDEGGHRVPRAPCHVVRARRRGQRTRSG